MSRVVAKARRTFVFLIIAAVTALTLLAGAQPKKRPPGPARPPGRPPAKVLDAGASATPVKETDASGAPTSAAGGKTEGVESKTIDGGAKVYRFGELEIETRLKSPQLVYFLRRVRAEFAAGDLGHRTFMKELSDTRTSPAF